MAELSAERGRLKRLLDARDGVAGVIAALRARLDLAEDDTPDSIVTRACADTAFELAIAPCTGQPGRQSTVVESFFQHGP